MTTQEQTPGPSFNFDVLRLMLAGAAEKHGGKITVLLIAIILLVAVYLTVHVVSGNALEEDSSRWWILGANKQSGALQEFAKNNPGTTQGTVARLEAARQLFAQGMTLYAATTEEGKKEAINSLDKSIELFDSLVNDPKLLLEQKAQALLNIGKAHEALRRFDKAQEYYTLAAAHSDSTAAGSQAVRKLDVLKTGRQSLVELYKTFE